MDHKRGCCNISKKREGGVHLMEIALKGVVLKRSGGISKGGGGGTIQGCVIKGVVIQEVGVSLAW